MFKFGDYMVAFIASLLCSLVVLYFINKNAYDNNGKLRCDKYVLSTYLYILLAFVLMGLFCLVYIYINLFDNLVNFISSSSNVMLIVVFILYIALIIGCFVLLKKLNPAKHGVLLHIIWIILLSLLSISFSITLIIGLANNTLMMALLLLVLITAATGIIGYKYGEQLLPVNFDRYLYGALMVLIVVQVISSFVVKDIETMEKMVYVFAAISLVIFVLLMLSYNKKIREHAEKCNIESNPPNYPNEAMGLVIKMLNVLQDLIVLLGRKGRK